MPRNGSGYYTLPAGNPVVDDTVIDVNWANPTMGDIALQLNNVLTRDGVLGPTLPFKLVDGTSGAPGLSFAAATGTGLWRDSTQLGVSYGGSTVFSVNANGIATAKGYSSSAAEALTLTNATSAIIFRSPSNQEPPGVVLSRNSGDVFKARGLGGLVFETNTTGLEYLSNALTPSIAGTVNLGTAAKPFNTLTAHSIYGVSATPVIKFIGGFNASVQFDTQIAVPTSALTSALLLIGGPHDPSGVAWSRLLLVALRVSGGASPDVAYTQIATVGSTSPVVTLSVVSGTLRIDVSGNGTGSTYVHMLGAF